MPDSSGVRAPRGKQVETPAVPRLMYYPPMQAAIYTRLSKDRGGLSENTAIQEREAREYAQQQGWSIVGAFTDNDTSASRYSHGPATRHSLARSSAARLKWCSARR
jgi:hypothetical protein